MDRELSEARDSGTDAVMLTERHVCFTCHHGPATPIHSGTQGRERTLGEGVVAQKPSGPWIKDEFTGGREQPRRSRSVPFCLSGAVRLVQSDGLMVFREDAWPASPTENSTQLPHVVGLPKDDSLRVSLSRSLCADSERAATMATGKTCSLREMRTKRSAADGLH